MHKVGMRLIHIQTAVFKQFSWTQMSRLYYILTIFYYV